MYIYICAVVGETHNQLLEYLHASLRQVSRVEKSFFFFERGDGGRASGQGGKTLRQTKREREKRWWREERESADVCVQSFEWSV